ncbi:MAG: hypothetical protein R3F61_13220 [Myxococcota bacterium]
MAPGDLLLYVDSVTNGLSTLVAWLTLGLLGVLCVFRSMQNPRIADLRVTGAALLLWVITDFLGVFTGYFTGFLDGVLGAIGLYMSFDAISVDVGRMIGSVLLFGGGYGIVQSLLSVAGGVPSAAGPAPATKASKPAKGGIPAAVPGGPPGAPGAPPGVPGPPGPPKA